MNFFETLIEATALALATLAATPTAPVLGRLALVLGAVGFGMLLNRRSG